MTTTKRDLVRLIAHSPIAVTQKLVNEVLNAFFDTVIDVLAQDGRLELRGFGTFFVVELPPHTGRNPKTGAPVTVHLKVNTGMNRLGVNVADAPALLADLRTVAGLHVEGIFTHFATSDLADKQHAAAQFGRFAALLADLRAACLCPPVAHAANSAAILTMPQTHLTMVRSGIALYGLDPDVDETPLPPGFTPVLSWKALVAQVRDLAPGDAVSYGREFIADRPMTVAVLPMGYADGFPRKPLNWGSVLIRGRAAPILGRVCMDQTIVDVTAIVAATGPLAMGEEAVLIGRQGDAELSAAEAAHRIGTINYDVTSRILARVPRIVKGESED